MAIQNINNALNAYTRAAQSVGAEPKPAEKVAPEAEGFADLVKSALEEAKRIGERGEQMSIQGIRDAADLNQVITAVAEAETTLQTVVSVRDKVIDAYKDIIRMPI